MSESGHPPMTDEDNSRKQVVLRLSTSLWRELAAWAAADFRSFNGQVEFLLTECVRQRKKREAYEEKRRAGAGTKPGDSAEGW